MEPSDHPPGGERKSATDSPHVTTVGGRQRFTVELKPDETTIVSWKKLMKNAVGKLECPAPDPKPVPNPHVALESRLAPGQPANNEATDAPHRFSTLIEKIERLYMGKHSSDEEDLNDVPDDDEYDTEDSFIDDAELDEYFQVDNSAIKHDGFFVNRGTLERIDQPPLLPNQQPKKRRRKDMEHVPGEGNDDRLHSKNVKRGKKAVVKAVLSTEKNSVGPSEVMAPTCAQLEDGRPYKQTSSSAMCARDQPSDQKTSLDPSPSRISNGDHSLPVQVGNDAQKIGLISSKNKGGRFQDGVGLSDGSFQRSHGKSSYEKGHSQNTILSKSADESDQSVHRKEKHGIHRKPDLNSFDGKTSLKTVKTPLVQRKDGSSVRPKSTALEKAIRELEKMVAESRPQSAEVQDGDISAQAVKRRLPHEVKQKLAKVARLAQASQGKISNELVNRLMSILGHLMQLRTLKRNLKAMIDMGLSAKKEKDDRFLQMKTEITELIRVRAPYIKSKALEHVPGTSGDIKEISPEDKELIKKRYCTDDALEEKLCDLYDLYLEGLDEDAGPRVRKLYAELAELWPDGLMDNHGVKRAICRAKDRKRSLHSQRKDQDKIKRQKLISRTEAVPVETAQSQSNMQENSVTVSSNHSLSSLSKPVATSTNTVSTSNNTVTSSPNSDWPKQEKVKGNSGNSGNSGETRPTDALRKKKVKRNPELESSKAHYRPEKLPSAAQGEEKQRTQPQVVVAPNLKPSLPLAPPSSTSQTILHDISQ